MTQPGRTRHFIYPLTLSGGYVFDESNDIRPENLVPDALRGTMDTWGLATNFRVIEPGDWVWAYFGGNVRQIHAVGTVTAPVGYSEEWGRYTVQVGWNAALTGELQKRPIRYEDYRQRVQASAARANPKTVSVLERWLQNAPSAVTTEVKHVPREVLQRLGQAAFRAEAVRLFGGRCAITGVSEPWVLQAVHIVPVSSGGAHSGANALLLRADLHALFDTGRLTIAHGLKVRVSRNVTDPEYRDLDGRRLQAPSGVSRAAFADALAKHREGWTG